MISVSETRSTRITSSSLRTRINTYVCSAQRAHKEMLLGGLYLGKRYHVLLRVCATDRVTSCAHVSHTKILARNPLKFIHMSLVPRIQHMISDQALTPL